jgi:hypothetical protein
MNGGPRYTLDEEGSVLTDTPHELNLDSFMC